MSLQKSLFKIQHSQIGLLNPFVAILIAAASFMEFRPTEQAESDVKERLILQNKNTIIPEYSRSHPYKSLIHTSPLPPHISSSY